MSEKEYPGGRTLSEWRHYLESRLRTLKEDVEIFGAAPEDRQRIANLEHGLAALSPEAKP